MNCPICGMECEQGALAPWYCPACKMYYDDGGHADDCGLGLGHPVCTCGAEVNP